MPREALALSVILVSGCTSAPPTAPIVEVTPQPVSSARSSGAHDDRAEVRLAEAERLLHEAATKEELAIAVKAFEDACAAGDRACSGLAQLYEDGTGVPEDEARALALYERGCAAGDGKSCAGAGLIDVNQGRNERGFARLTESCKSRWAGGCFNLVMLAYTGDPAHDVPLFELACEGGAMNGCALLADAYLEGRGVAKDRARAEKLYEKACALDRGAESCETLKRLRHE